MDCELNLLNSKTATFCATQKLTPRKNKKMFFSFLSGMPEYDINNKPFYPFQEEVLFCSPFRRRRKKTECYLSRSKDAKVDKFLTKNCDLSYITNPLHWLVDGWVLTKTFQRLWHFCPSKIVMGIFWMIIVYCCAEIILESRT